MEMHQVIQGCNSTVQVELDFVLHASFSPIRSTRMKPHQNMFEIGQKCKYLAIFVKSSSTSQATTTPSGGSARAAASELAPVKTPTSITFLVPFENEFLVIIKKRIQAK